MLTKTQILDHIVTQVQSLLAQGQIPPWQRPWTPSPNHRGAAWNPITQKAYRGMNVVILSTEAMIRGYSDPRWMGYQQAAKEGWQVRKGETGTTIYHPVSIRARAKKSEDGASPASSNASDESAESPTKTFLMFKAFRVFNAAQMDNVPSLDAGSEEESPPPRIPQATLIDALAQVMNVPVQDSHDGRAYYVPAADRIAMPPRSDFASPADYESVRLHELGHATGHASRLARDLSGSFGSAKYAAEEITAELAAYLASLEWGIATTGVNPDVPADQHAVYMAGWAKALKEGDQEAFRKAIDNGLKAMRYLSQMHDLAVTQGLIPGEDEEMSAPEEESDMVCSAS